MRDRSLRIAMLSLHSSPLGELGSRDTGGMSVYVREVASELAARGHRVDLFTRQSGGVTPPVVPVGPGVRLVHLEGGANGHGGKLGLYPMLPAYLRALQEFCDRDGHGYHVVHSHYWLSACLGARAAQLWSAPHVVMFHTLGAVKNAAGCGENEPEVRLREEADLARRCDRTIAPTARERDHLLRYCGAPAARVAVVPCGVNETRFGLRDRGESRRRLGLSEAARVLLYVGRFAPVKGPERLLDAVSLLWPRDRLRVLLVGGDGPGSPADEGLRARVRALGLGDVVTFVGRVAQGDLPGYYSAADALVLPSHYESFGLVALEALACGTPVVATRVGAMEELVDPAVNGLVVDGEPGALARGVEEALERVGGGAWPRERIRASVAGYTWSRVAEALLAEYRGLLAHRASSAVGAAAAEDAP